MSSPTQPNLFNYLNIICTSCKVEKPKTEYYGRTKVCKECHNMRTLRNKAKKALEKGEYLSLFVKYDNFKVCKNCLEIKPKDNFRITKQKGLYLTICTDCEIVKSKKPMLGNITCTSCNKEKPQTKYYSGHKQCKECFNMRTLRKKAKKALKDGVLLSRTVKYKDYKVCTRCNELLPKSDFYYREKRKIYENNCKKCHSITVDETRCKDTYKKNQKKYRADPKNKERAKEYSEKYREENYKELQVKKKEYVDKPEIKARRNQYLNDKYKNDIQFKLKHTMRANISRMIKEFKGIERFYSNDMPYTPNELKTHIENQFDPWMTWENRGVSSTTIKTWQIDHIIPLSHFVEQFDGTNAETLILEANALKNLQPLESLENNQKSNKLSSTI